MKKHLFLSLLLLAIFSLLPANGADWEKEFLSGPYSNWGLADKAGSPNINIVPAWKNFEKKKEVVVAIVDTGIDESQDFFKSNIYLPKNIKNTKAFGMDFTNGTKVPFEPIDHHGHGTHIAGIIKGVYPDVKLLILKYIDPQSPQNDDLKSSLAALKFAVDQNVDIINYSGGGQTPDQEELKILKQAEKKGIIIVAAAGNEGSNIDEKFRTFYPASYGLSNIITVAAHDETGQLLSSSNWGKNTVDISAPGNRIKSTYLHGRAGYLNGTSQATAFVSGVAALLKAKYPSLDFKKIRALIKDSAMKEKNLAVKCSSGGYLSAGRAMALAEFRYTKKEEQKRNVAQSLP